MVEDRQEMQQQSKKKFSCSKDCDYMVRLWVYVSETTGHKKAQR